MPIVAALPKDLSSIQNKQLDIKIDGLISRHVAEEVFQQYIDSFAPTCPMVVFPPGTTPTLVRETRPVLFLAVISVASTGYCAVEEQQELVAETRRQIADIAVVRGSKSLELVQALQVALLWYRAPGDYEQMSMNQLAQIMVTVATDAGLDVVHKPELSSMCHDTWSRAEAHRAWLGCFLLSARYFHFIETCSTTNRVSAFP